MIRPGNYIDFASRLSTGCYSRGLTIKTRFDKELFIQI